MSLVPDQKPLWDEKHKHNRAAFQVAPSHFAQKIIHELPEHATILEIGCGAGADAAFFAKNGYSVIATGLSSVTIELCKVENSTQGNVQFQQLDVSKPLPFASGQFDVVYSHLALHYYSDETTHAVFKELYRVLRSGGVLAFACKSLDDVDYGKGELIEKDFFNANGHVRHFFSTGYVRSLLGDAYDIALLDEVTERYSGKESSFVQCVALKRA